MFGPLWPYNITPSQVPQPTCYWKSVGEPHNITPLTLDVSAPTPLSSDVPSKTEDAINDNKTLCILVAAQCCRTDFSIFTIYCIFWVALLPSGGVALVPDFLPRIAHHWNTPAAIGPVSCPNCPSSLSKEIFCPELPIIQTPQLQLAQFFAQNCPSSLSRGFIFADSTSSHPNLNVYNSWKCGHYNL